MNLDFDQTEIIIPFPEFGEEVSVHCEPLTTVQETTLKKQFTKKKRIDGVLQEIVDEEGLMNTRFDKMVRSWPGVKDKHGKPLPCNRANKLQVLNKKSTFAGLILLRLEEAQKEELGNSQTSLSSEQAKNSG